MDEYTFLIAAQLKADREKLEREKTDAKRREGVPAHGEPTTPAKLIPLFNWR